MFLSIGETKYHHGITMPDSPKLLSLVANGIQWPMAEAFGFAADKGRSHSGPDPLGTQRFQESDEGCQLVEAELVIIGDFWVPQTYPDIIIQVIGPI